MYSSALSGADENVVSKQKPDKVPMSVIKLFALLRICWEAALLLHGNVSFRLRPARKAEANYYSPYHRLRW